MYDFEEIPANSQRADPVVWRGAIVRNHSVQQVRRSGEMPLREAVCVAVNCQFVTIERGEDTGFLSNG